MKLLEIKGPESAVPHKVQRIARVLVRDCRPFLEEISYDISEYPLFRGIFLPPTQPHEYRGTFPSSKRSYETRTARLKDRRALHSRLVDHEAANRFFTQEYGKPFRNGVMATGRERTTMGYGMLSAIFPIGQFEYLWSPTIQDLNDVFGALRRQFIADRKTQTEPDVYDFISEYGDYQHNKHLKEAIKSGNEIMLWVRKYHTLYISPTHKDPSDHPNPITRDEFEQIADEVYRIK